MKHTHVSIVSVFTEMQVTEGRMTKSSLAMITVNKCMIDFLYRT